MSETNQQSLRRVLIASANPLFAKGLQRLVAQRWEGRRVETRLASSMDEANTALDNWQPDLVIVDYDDVDRPGSIQRSAFLSHFIAGDRAMQVMLVSLRESGEVVVYDRRTLTPAQAEDWLDLPWISSPANAAGNAPAEAGTPAAPENVSAADAEMPQEQRPAPVPAAPSVQMPPPSRPETLFGPRSGGMKRGGMKKFIPPAISTVVLTALIGFALQNVGLMPNPSSEQAGPIDSMVFLQAWIISFLFSLIVSFIGFSIFYYHRREGDRGYGENFSNSNKLEVAWTLIPLGVIIWLAFIGAKDLADVRRPEANAMTVNVTAFQWGWQFEYPDSGVKTNQLYLPVNRQVDLVMTSRDVIHSFWVPEFRVKQDVLPGQNLVKDLRITPDKIGKYKVYCAELCGGAHAYMVAPVNVVTQADFDAWIASQGNTANQTPDQRGKKLVQDNGCTGCHSTDGSARPGPTWKGLAGSQVKLADGSTVTADDAYLKQSITDPNAHIVNGFPPNLMPQTYKSALNDQQINDIVAFIKTLK